MSTSTKDQPQVSLEDRLWKSEHDLMQIARRQYALEAFLEELNRATRGNPFRIWNDILWTMVLDSRDMLVIHLASWAKGIYARSGLLSQVKAHHLAELPALWRPTARTQRDAHLGGLLAEAHRAAFQRQFPKNTGHQASTADLDGLVERLRTDAAPLLKDRNENRAHAFEAGSPGSAKMLDLTEVRDALTMAESLLNDLRLVGCGSTMSHHDMNDADCASTAIELVDSILIGHSFRKESVMVTPDRIQFYATLHERHGAPHSDRQVMFNDNYD